MRVRDIEARNRDGEYELSAQVVFEAPPREERRVWLRVPGEREAPPTPGDVFVAAFLLPCLALGESLAIDAPVSAELLEAAQQRIAPVMGRWYRRGTTVPVACASVVPGLPQAGRRTGAFLSGGVDGWHTLLRNADRIDALVTVHGLEIDAGNEPIGRLAFAHSEAIAREHGKAFLPVVTNLREASTRATILRLRAQGRPWHLFGLECNSGSLLVALGHFLSADFERLLIASSWSWERTRPAGSHPLIEPRWSTPRLAFELDGCDQGRIEKLREIRRRCPGALTRLRVCIGRPQGRMNCGRCLKCVRTMLEMRAAGAAGAVPALFPDAPSLAEIRCMRIRPDDYFLPDLIREADAIGDRELAWTVRILQGERFHLPRVVARQRRRLARQLRRRWERLRATVGPGQGSEEGA